MLHPTKTAITVQFSRSQRIVKFLVSIKPMLPKKIAKPVSIGTICALVSFGITPTVVLGHDLPSLRAKVVSIGTLPNNVGGDMEIIEAIKGDTPLGLIAYVRNRQDGSICRRTQERKQRVFVRALDSFTGLPFGNELEVANNECNASVRSDAEFGLGPNSEPLLSYTSPQGVQLVQFLGDSWRNIRVLNQTIPGSDNWLNTANGLSLNFPKLQIKAIAPHLPIDSSDPRYELIWGQLSIAPDGTISEYTTIDEFENIPISEPQKSQLHPENPTRFLRAGEDGIYEYSDNGQDLALIYSQRPVGRLFGGFRTWTIPAHECVALGLQPENSSGGCPGIAIPDQDANNEDFVLIIKARNSDGVWIELLSIPYSKLPRVNATVISSLNTPRSIIYVTGDGNATLYSLDGSSFIAQNGNVSSTDSELVFFSSSGLLGVYYSDLTLQRKVTMVNITER